MKPFLAAVLAIAVGALLAGCASGGASSPGADRADRAAAGGSGVTVFGTIDAGVSGSRNR